MKKVVSTIIDAHGIAAFFKDEAEKFAEDARVYSACGVVKTDNAIISFWTMQRFEMAYSGESEKIAFHFLFGKKQKFQVLIDDDEVAIERIERLSFYAHTDLGTILVSYCPAFSEDARPLAMVATTNKRLSIFLQHLAAAWLHEIWGKK